MTVNTGNLFLIPNTLGEENPIYFLPDSTLEIIHELTYFIVENEKSARRFLKNCKIKSSQNDLIIYPLDKHNKKDDAAEFMEHAFKKSSIGLISEAGVPAVADPGNIIVRKAHESGIHVVPLVGPSSILMALMASGLNGQEFTFHGYLPIQTTERKKAIKKLELESNKTGYTQLFIETPYRNNALLKDILETCSQTTRLSVATNILHKDESFNFYVIADWKKLKLDLNKKPSVFLIQA